VWDQGDEVWVGEDRDSPYPLGVCPPDMPLDCVSDSEEDFYRVKKVARFKIKGRRDVLNLKSSINYGDASVPSRGRKRKAQVL